MIATLVPKVAKLPPEQRRLWPELRPATELGFVLYGGTAVSLHLGHRRSVDFDFFCDRPLAKATIRAVFPFMQRAAILQDASETLVALVPAKRSAGANPVKIAFYGGLAFGRVGDPLLTRDGVLEVASLRDLMAHKLKVILQRSEKKDYVDIAAMIRAGCVVTDALAATRAMFGKAFQPAAALKALVYFEDGDLASLSRADRNILIGAASAVGPLPVVKLRSKRLDISIGGGA